MAEMEDSNRSSSLSAEPNEIAQSRDPSPVEGQHAPQDFTGISTGKKSVTIVGGPETPKSSSTVKTKDIESLTTDDPSPGRRRKKNESVHLEKLRSARRMTAEAERANRTRNRTKDYLKCIAPSIVIIFSIFFFSYFLYFGWNEDDPKKPHVEEPANRTFEIQDVWPGQLVSFASSGNFLAIRNDFERVQVYRCTNKTNGAGQSWDSVGQTLRAVDTVDFSTNGTQIAYLDSVSQRPDVMAYGSNRDVWRTDPAPLVVGDELSMDSTATLMTVALYNRAVESSDTPVDILITYKFDGEDWNELTKRLILHGVVSFELSPTASTLVVTNKKEGHSSPDLLVYHMEDDEEEAYWQQVQPDVQLQEDSSSISLAAETIAVSSTDHVDVYSYGGRKWGQTLHPRNGTVFTSVALSTDGRTLAVASRDQETERGFVEWYTFPYYQDTADDWQAKGPALEEEWAMDNDSLRDNHGAEAPRFGSKIALDAEGGQIAVQSGTEGNENVHLFRVFV